MVQKVKRLHFRVQQHIGGSDAKPTERACPRRSIFDLPMTPKNLKTHRAFNLLRLGQPRSMANEAASQLSEPFAKSGEAASMGPCHD
jgi:hypothetical protein